jgi:hypothetical protein
MKKHQILKLIQAYAMACGLCIAPATEASDSTTTTSPPTSKAKKAKAPKPPVDKGYGENRVERDKRLQRECRGKPNSGACEGYAN